MPLRTVVEEDAFSTVKGRIFPTCERADEFLDGAIWRVSRDPESGTLLWEETTTTPSVWGLEHDTPGASLFILYAFDADCVYLMSLVTA